MFHRVQILQSGIFYYIKIKDKLKDKKNTNLYTLYNKIEYIKIYVFNDLTHF